MRDKSIIAGFNKWFDEFVNHPERFKEMSEVIGEYLKEKNAGHEVTYGDRCLGWLKHYAEL